MKALLLSQLCRFQSDWQPLELVERAVPTPAPGELLIRVAACGVCHTELDEIEGRLPPSSLPRVLGHQVVGTIDRVGDGVEPGLVGSRVGVAWIYRACGVCRFCLTGRENLCPFFEATGRDADGGYAEYMVAPAAFTLPLPDAISDVEAAPLLCAGAIGCRALRLTGLADGEPLGLTGFGASGHLVLQIARNALPHSRVFVFARDERARAFARQLGADWAGAEHDRPPDPPAAIIDTTPAWRPVVEALAALAPGGRVVINAIRKEAGDRQELLRIDYAEHLWREKEIKTVANLTRDDVREMLALAVAGGIRPTVETWPLDAANRALRELKAGAGRGAKVLVMEPR